MAKSATFVLGPERLHVERIGDLYQLTRADGTVYGLYLRESDATAAAIRLSNLLRVSDV